MIQRREDPGFLGSRLDDRKRLGSLRKLPTTTGLIDFCSNDYLGLVHGHRLETGHGATHRTGSTGSRLLSGNSTQAENLEAAIAEFHGASSGLLFNSGYDANLGLLSTVPQEQHVILYDQQAHASIHDGIRLSRATSFAFRHNDLDHLARRLDEQNKPTFVVVESVYSMDGDLAPLESLADLCDAKGALLIVDEAHATGVFGLEGRGLVSAHGLESRVFARVHTFGKALGCHGAVVLGSHQLREVLVNFAHSFIYTTALPPQSLSAIECAYDVFPSLDDERAHLFDLVRQFRIKSEGLPRVHGAGPIQGILADGNDAARELASRLHEAGIDARAILSPTVQRGSERVRICLHAFNTHEQVDSLFRALEGWR